MVTPDANVPTGAAAGALPSPAGHVPSSTEDASALLGALESWTGTVRRAFTDLAAVPVSIEAAVSWVGGPARWVAVILCTAALLAAGGLSARLVGRWAARSGRTSSTSTRGQQVLVNAAFLIAGLVLHLVLPVDRRLGTVSLALFLAAASVQMLSSVVQSALSRAPGAGARRLLPLVRVGLALMAAGYLALGLMRLSGAPQEGRLAFGMLLWIALVGVGYACLARWRDLSPVVSSNPPEPSAGQAPFDPVSRLVCDASGWFFGSVLALVACMTVVAALRDGPSAFRAGAWSLLALGALPIVLSLLPLPRLADGILSHPWRATASRCGRLSAFIGFWLLLARLHGIDLFAIASDRIGERAVRVLIDIGVAVALGYLLWQVASTALDSLLASQPVRDGETDPVNASGAAPRAASRVATFVPLLRTIAVALIVSTTGMIVLASLGVDIGPLLAGAGIFGIALGFGSQALVKDVISGLFFLSDDAFRLGEYVEIGSAKGTVESLSIRSLKLRHSRGAVYTVPFGQIGVVNNQSRDWAIVKLEFLVDFDTDLRKVKSIVREISAAAEADEELRKALLQPVKFQGVRRMEAYGMVVGIKFTAVPGEQFVLRKEIYARVRDAFAKAGIRFARPHVRVDPPGPADALHPDQGTRAAAALHEVAPDRPAPDGRL